MSRHRRLKSRLLTATKITEYGLPIALAYKSGRYSGDGMTVKRGDTATDVIILADRSWLTADRRSRP